MIIIMYLNSLNVITMQLKNVGYVILDCIYQHIQFIEMKKSIAWQN